MKSRMLSGAVMGAMAVLLLGALPASAVTYNSGANTYRGASFYGQLADGYANGSAYDSVYGYDYGTIPGSTTQYFNPSVSACVTVFNYTSGAYDSGCTSNASDAVLLMDPALTLAILQISAPSTYSSNCSPSGPLTATVILAGMGPYSPSIGLGSYSQSRSATVVSGQASSTCAGDGSFNPGGSGNLSESDAVAATAAP